MGWKAERWKPGVVLGGSSSGWKGHVELGRKGVQDVVVFLGFEWGQGCEC